MIAQRGTTEPWAGRVRVDLQAGLFCQDDCKAAERIVEIGPEIISLRNKKALQHTDEVFVNRITGGYNRYRLELGAGAGSPNEFTENYEAKCTVAPFTGFPKALF